LLLLLQMLLLLLQQLHLVEHCLQVACNACLPCWGCCLLLLLLLILVLLRHKHARSSTTCCCCSRCCHLLLLLLLLLKLQQQLLLLLLLGILLQLQQTKVWAYPHHLIRHSSACRNSGCSSSQRCGLLVEHHPRVHQHSLRSGSSRARDAQPLERQHDLLLLLLLLDQLRLRDQHNLLRHQLLLLLRLHDLHHRQQSWLLLNLHLLLCSCCMHCSSSSSWGLLCSRL
jgi:hypothetical protein